MNCSSAIVVIYFFVFFTHTSFRFFFFKQRTAYEMRISDWSSDVCSSDLRGRQPREGGELVHHPADIADLAHDRIGAHRKRLRIALDLLEIFADRKSVV